MAGEDAQPHPCGLVVHLGEHGCTTTIRIEPFRGAERDVELRIGEVVAPQFAILVVSAVSGHSRGRLRRALQVQLQPGCSGA